MRLGTWFAVAFTLLFAAGALRAQDIDVNKVLGKQSGPIQFAPIDTSKVQLPPGMKVPAPKPNKFSLFSAIPANPFAWLVPKKPLPPVFTGPTANGVKTTPTVKPNQSTYRAILRQERREDRRERDVVNQQLLD